MATSGAATDWAAVAQQIEAIDQEERDDDVGRAAKTPDDEWDTEAI